MNILRRRERLVADALHVFTSAAVNYLPKVRILCHSIRRYHPEAVIHLALADERPQWLRTEDEPFDSILGIERLGIPDYRNWTFTHSIVELSTAIKPFALEASAAAAGLRHRALFRSRTWCCSRASTTSWPRSRRSNLALTPHQTKPEQTLDAIFDNEVASLKHGIFNLGFIGVRNTAEGRRFADWWSERTYHLCWADVENGLFTDQKWINFAPVFFDGVAIIKSLAPQRRDVEPDDAPDDRQLRDRLRGRRRAARLLPFHGIRQRRAPDHGDQERVGEPGGAGAHHVVRGRDRRSPIAIPSANGRGRSGASRTGRRSSPAIAGSIAITAICRRRSREPYDAGTDRIELSRLVQVRGAGALPRVVRRRRCPQGAEAAPAWVRSVSLPMALRLFRSDAVAEGRQGVAGAGRTVLRREGLGGFARRLHGPRG